MTAHFNDKGELCECGFGKFQPPAWIAKTATENSNLLYHASDVGPDKILKEGLMANDPAQGQWAGEGMTPSVYLALTPRDASEYGQHMYQVDATGLPLQWDSQYNWHEGDIPPERIKYMGEFDPYTYDYDQRQSSWSISSKSVVRPFHFNTWTGEECKCAYGQNRERQLHKNRLMREMRILSALNNNGIEPHPSSHVLNRALKSPQKIYKTPMGKAFLKHLRYVISDRYHDLTPYLANHFAKGNIIGASADGTMREINPDDIASGKVTPSWYYKNVDDAALHNYLLANPSEMTPDMLPMLRAQARKEPRFWHYMGRRTLDSWNQFYQAKRHPLRQGLNIMDKDFTPARLDESAMEFYDIIQKEKEEKQEKERMLDHLKSGHNIHYFDEVKPGDDIDWKSVQSRPGSIDRTLEERMVHHIPNRYPLTPDDQAILDELKEKYPHPGRPGGWHIKHVNPPDSSEEDREATLDNIHHFLGHCFNDYNYPYREKAVNGDIDVYSLCDHEGKPHVTFHYGPDFQLNPTYPDDHDQRLHMMEGREQQSELHPDYQKMISEWGEKNGLTANSTSRINALGEDAALNQWNGEYLLPAPDNFDDYVTLMDDSYDARWERAVELLLNEGYDGLGEEGYVTVDEPDWKKMSRKFLNTYLGDKGTIGDYGPHISLFTRLLKDNFHHENFSKALIDNLKDDYPKWPDIKERDDQKRMLQENWPELLAHYNNHIAEDRSDIDRNDFVNWQKWEDSIGPGGMVPMPDFMNSQGMEGAARQFHEWKRLHNEHPEYFYKNKFEQELPGMWPQPEEYELLEKWDQRSQAPWDIAPADDDPHGFNQERWRGWNTGF